MNHTVQLCYLYYLHHAFSRDFTAAAVVSERPNYDAALINDADKYCITSFIRTHPSVRIPLLLAFFLYFCFIAVVRSYFLRPITFFLYTGYFLPHLITPNDYCFSVSTCISEINTKFVFSETACLVIKLILTLLQSKLTLTNKRESA